MRVGIEEKELFEVLSDLDETTNVDSVLNTRQKVVITAERKNGHLSNWSLMEDMDGYSGSVPYTKGVGYRTLEAALSSIDKEESFNESINVLCYLSTEPAKSWDGKIVSKWFNVSPGVPFDIKDGKPDFQTITLELKESDYKVMMESRLALYNEFSGDIYPIRKMAFSSIGKLMDCAASFKYLAEIPLGSALLIAERLSTVRNLKFLYRYRSENVKPLIAIAGTRYVKYSQLDFFKKALDFVSSKTICHIERWAVSDELTTINVVLDGTAGYSIYLKIQTSDIPGTSISVSAYAKIGRGSLLLLKNSSYHWSSFEENGGVKTLFNGMFETIDEFKENYNELAEKEVDYDGSYMANILKILGKKRSSKVKPVESGTYMADSLLRKIVDATYSELPVKQAGELAKCYSRFFKELLEENLEDTGVV